MRETYSITIAGVKRELPRYAVSDSLDIAAFILFGDVEITVAAAEALLKKAPDFDIILTPEAKSIPLAYEMARQSGKPYVVARKGVKVYMGSPVAVEVHAITTQSTQHLYLGEDECSAIRGKRVLIIDDVISTGASLAAIRPLGKEAGGIEAGAGAVLAEGDAAGRTDIFYLEELPLFFK